MLGLILWASRISIAQRRSAAIIVLLPALFGPTKMFWPGRKVMSNFSNALYCDRCSLFSMEQHIS